MTHRRVISRGKRKSRKRTLVSQAPTQTAVLPHTKIASASNSLVNTIPLDSSPVGEPMSKEKRSSLSRLFTTTPSILAAHKKQDLKSSAFTSESRRMEEPDLVLNAVNTNGVPFDDELETHLILGSISTTRLSLSDQEYSDQEISDDNTTERVDDSDVTSSSSSDLEKSLRSSESNISSFGEESHRNGGSNMMYNYSVPDSNLLARNRDILFSSSNGQLKLAQGALGTKTKADLSKELSVSDFQNSKNDEITFEKVSSIDLNKNQQSLLSSMINVRQELINENPLSYFNFVSPDSLDSDFSQTKIDVFVPPKTAPVLKKVAVVTNVSIFDCVGYFISQVIMTDEYKNKKTDEAFMDPNSWRMELIDSEGDLYDSTFGVLDRTRLLSSYNCPKFLGICRVTNTAEIARNNKQTPLPPEFKQNLKTFQQRIVGLALSTSVPEQMWETLPNNSVEVLIGDIPNQRKEPIKMFVSSTMQIGGLLDMICRQYQISQTDYKLVGVENTNIKPQPHLSELISDVEAPDGREVALESTATIEELGMYTFKLVSTSKQIVRLMSSMGNDGEFLLKTGITPEASASYIQTGITPPYNTIKELPKKASGTIPVESNRPTTRTPGRERRHRTGEFKFDPSNFDDQFRTKSPEIPTTVNTLYFKWKVYRKKPPLLNRIEKSLIIDGDYVHIAPADDVSLKKTSADMLYGSHSESKHHHHYLHHYNYSKYYNDTMMKTSSFHVSQIIEVKHYKKSKIPLQFKIVVAKDSDQGGKDTVIQKKYDLEAENDLQLKDIMRKIDWARRSYDRSLVN